MQKLIVVMIVGLFTVGAFADCTKSKPPKKTDDLRTEVKIL